MKNTAFTFVSEPHHQNYKDLVDYAASQCKYVSMVVHHTKPLDKYGIDVLMSLEPYLKDRSERSEWPGTKLLRGTVIGYMYELVPETVQIIKSSTFRLYGWEQPRLPEDICFFIDSINPFLFVISHEKDSVIDITESQISDLENRYPYLSKMLRVDKPAASL